jgi:hypothetical protein
MTVSPGMAGVVVSDGLHKAQMYYPSDWQMAIDAIFTLRNGNISWTGKNLH